MNQTPDHRSNYQEHGFTIVPSIVPVDRLKRVRQHIDQVMDGQYERAGEIFPSWKKGDDATLLRKIDQAHVVDSVIHEIISDPAIGSMAAQLTGAKRVQVWATQLLYKPPGGRDRGNVGWHQDQDYWAAWWDKSSNLFTAWLAISDVPASAGPVIFVPGSHRWGHLAQGNFFGKELDQIKQGMNLPPGATWTEAPATMTRGSCSFHHRLTIHGSGPNVSESPRISFAIHLRTEDSRPGESHFYNQHLDDPIICPIIYRTS